MKTLLKTRTYYDDPPAVPPVVPPPPPPPGPVTFTPEQQAHLNKLLAEQKRTVVEQNKELVTQLEELRKSAGLTQQEKEGLDARIQALQQQHLTDAQKLKLEVEAANKKLKENTEASEAESRKWKGSFEKLLVTNAILEGATTHKAANAKQLEAILLPQAKIVEAVDDAGKPTGEYVAKLAVKTVDPKTKQPVILELPIVEAIKMMRDDPQNANLFLVDGKPGFGGSGGVDTKTGAGGEINWAALSPAEHREMRKKLNLDRNTK